MTSELLSACACVIGVGLCFLLVGAIMVKTGFYGLIHSYHIALIPKSRLPFVARLVGFGMMLLGIGLVLAGLCFLETGDTISVFLILAIVLILTGLTVVLATIVIFTFRPWL